MGPPGKFRNLNDKKMKKKTSINIRPAKTKISEAHNERKVKLDYVMPELTGNNEHWKEDSIASRLNTIKETYFMQVG